MSTALVTGANRGLGLETARQLKKKGFRVIGTSRREFSESGVEWRPLDVTDATSIAALADGLKRNGVTLDVLVNNAGISMRGFDENVARGTLGTNFFGAMHVTEALLPLVADGGTIVMVSSGMGELSSVSAALKEKLLAPSLTRSQLLDLLNGFIAGVKAGTHEQDGWPSSAYRVSKIGMNMLTRIWASELAKRRIAINAVCPGWVRTDMGGPSAPRSLDQGTASIVAAALIKEKPTGGFFRDGRQLEW